MKLLTHNSKILTKTDKQILEIINQNIDKITNLSIAELSQLAFCSKATISRFVRKFGYKDYKEFIISVNYDYRKYKETVEPENSTIVDTILNHEAFAINNLNIKNRDKTIDNTVNVLENADKIIIFGMGSSSLAAQELHYNLSKIGLNSYWSDSMDRVIPVIANIGKSDLLILISKSADNKYIDFVVNATYKNNAKIILITSNDKHIFGDKVDITFTHTNAEQTLRVAALTSKISQNIIIDLIFNVLVHRNKKYKSRILSSRKLFLDWKETPR